MDKVKIFYSKDTDTLDIWFGDPEDEFIAEEAGEGIIFKKNKTGKVIGIEKLYVKSLFKKQEPISVELLVS